MIQKEADDQEPREDEEQIEAAPAQTHGRPETAQNAVGWWLHRRKQEMPYEHQQHRDSSDTVEFGAALHEVAGLSCGGARCLRFGQRCAANRRSVGCSAS